MKEVLIGAGVVLILATLLAGWLGPAHGAFRARLLAWWMMAISFVIINRIHPSLSLVGFAGYRVGAGDTASPDGLVALALVYAVLPALIKFVSLGLLLYWKNYFEEVSA